MGKKKRRHNAAQPSQSLFWISSVCVCAHVRVTEVFPPTLLPLLLFPLRAAGRVQTGVTEGKSEVSPPGGKSQCHLQDLSTTKLKVLPSSSEWMTAWTQKILKLTSHSFFSSSFSSSSATVFFDYCWTPWTDTSLLECCFSFCPFASSMIWLFRRRKGRCITIRFFPFLHLKKIPLMEWLTHSFTTFPSFRLHYPAGGWSGDNGLAWTCGKVLLLFWFSIIIIAVLTIIAVVIIAIPGWSAAVWPTSGQEWFSRFLFVLLQNWILSLACLVAWVPPTAALTSSSSPLQKDAWWEILSELRAALIKPALDSPSPGGLMSLDGTD